MHDALVYLYDTAYLQMHPLARLAGRYGGGEAGGAGASLRQSLVDTIESLRAGGAAGFPAETQRSYQILRLRFLDGLDTARVQDQLAISKSTYYREYHRGMAAVTSVLRERWGVGE